MDHLKLVHNEINVVDIMKLVSSPSCGATSLFVGTTRDHFEGKTVKRLVYEAYEGMVQKSLKTLCDDIRSKWNVHGIAIYHRLGEVAVEEASIVIAVSSEHRAESLQAVQYAIDKLKADVPIWKKEEYDGDSTSQWKENKESSWIKTEPEENVTPDIEPVSFTVEDISPKLIQVKAEMNERIESKRNQGNLSNIREFCSKSSSNSSSARVDSVFVENISSELIQVKADDAEMKRRMESFMEFKRNQVNLSNIRDFCSNSSSDSSCARVDAVIVRQKDSKGHLRVRRVLNKTGPQTQGIEQWPPNSGVSSVVPSFTPKHKKGPALDNSALPSSCPSAVEERLRNAEQHLGINNAFNYRPVPKDVYARLKQLEDRILFLEGVSPEYSQVLTDVPKLEPVDKKPKISKKKVYSVEDLDKRMKDLEKSIKNNSDDKFVE